MARIKLPCPQCGHCITIELDTIDKLRADLSAMTSDRDAWKRKCAALEVLKNKHDNPLADLMRGFGMK